jgi:tetratricopeptide (TPR) repeat protein
MKEFIIVGGLDTLAELIDDDNLYLRGQVLEVLLSATDCDTYDWFKPPDSYSDKQLHNKLLDLGRSPVFLRKLLSNRTGSYPGGSFRALQLIAFTLSWIRALYTADQKLQLSSAALTQLQLWSVPKTEQADQSSYGAADHNGDPASDPEVQLARTLLDDFVGELNASIGADNGDSSCVHGVLATPIDDQALSEVQLGRPAVGSGCDDAEGLSSTLSAEELKTQGNDLFKAGRFEEAIEHYRSALNALSGHSGQTVASASQKVGELMAPSLHSNIAAAWWKVIQDCLLQQPELELQLSPTTISTNILSSDKVPVRNAVCTKLLLALGSCATACYAALALQPTHAKAAYRLASVLLLQQAPQQALLCVDQCISKLRETGVPSEASSQPSAVRAEESADNTGLGGVEMLQQMKRRCIAVLLLEERDELAKTRLANPAASAGTSRDSSRGSELGLSGKTGEILRALLVQYQIELDIPVKHQPTKCASKTVLGTSSISELTDTLPEVAEKPKKKKKVATGTSSVAKRLQEIDDNTLDALMSRTSVK